MLLILLAGVACAGVLMVVFSRGELPRLLK
jgi:hypothetical protein